MPILKVLLGNAPVEGLGIQQKMVNIGLLVFPCHYLRSTSVDAQKY